MSSSWKSYAVVGALCLGIVTAASVGMAQDRQPGPGPNAPAMGPRGPGMPGMDRGKMMEEMRARREKTLHDVLAIKPDQEGAFRAYLAAAAPPPMDRDRAGRPAREAMTTPERLDRMAAQMADRQARFQKVAAATKTFYAALTPDQRRAFDALPMMMAGPEGRGGRMGHGPMMRR